MVEIIARLQLHKHLTCSKKLNAESKAASLIVPEGATVVKSSHHYTETTKEIITDQNRETTVYTHDYFKYRTDRAYVDHITSPLQRGDVVEAHSSHDNTFKYIEGKSVTLRPNEKLDTGDSLCSSGIHFFTTLKEAAYFKT